MANSKELRRRIKSVKNTAQITKAMQMVSATKMRRAQNQALGGRPYSTSLNEIISSIEGRAKLVAHPLLHANTSTKRGVLALSSDKGLAGALNTNIIRRILLDEILQDKETIFYTIGKKAREYLVRTGRILEADFENLERASFKQAKMICKMFLEAFLAGNLGEVYILYPHFVSPLKQEPTLIKLLPISPVILSDSEGSHDFLFEPDIDSVLDFALEHFLETQIYQAMLETKASEHSARMIAMQNATDNAKALVGDLELSYNQVRQSAITTQILEIASAASALE